MAATQRSSRRADRRSDPKPLGFAQAQQGIALVAVLWMVAALMVTASGIVYAVRGEVRAVSSYREMAGAGAMADAGIVLAARELAVTRDRGAQRRSYEAVLDGVRINVRTTALTGLIDLNAASEALLTDFFAVAGGMDRSRASSFAQRVIDWRDADEQPHPEGAEDAAYAAAGSPFRTRGGPFDTPEDLLQVLEVDFDLFVRLRPLFTVHIRGGGRVDPVAAPPAVLRVLASGNEQTAAAYASARDTNGVLADSTRFPAAYLANTQTRRFLVEASVQLSNGAYLVVRRIVDVSSGQSGVPWITLWSERVVEPEPAV